MSFWTQIILTNTNGGSITLTAPISGTIDGSNKAFVFSSKPTVLVSDSTTYRESYGWSWNSSTFTVTMVSAPLYDLFSLN